MSEDSDRHLQTIRSLSRMEAFSPSGPHASMQNPAWFTAKGKPTDARDELHEELLAGVGSGFVGVGRERCAVVLAGPPGAGKSSALNGVFGGEVGRFAVVDPDEFKVGLLRRAVEDGSFESFFKPDEVRVLEADGEKFFPMEFAALVHNESSLLARKLRGELVAEGRNVVIDTVLAGQAKAVELGELFGAAGYEVRVLDVEASFEVSTARVEARWRSARVQALEGGDGLGGRWVPSDFARFVFNPDGSSKSEFAARLLAETYPNVSRFQVFRVEGLTDGPRLDIDLARASYGAALLPVNRPAGSDERRAGSSFLGLASSEASRPPQTGLRAGRGPTPGRDSTHGIER